MKLNEIEFSAFHFHHHPLNIELEEQKVQLHIQVQVELLRVQKKSILPILSQRLPASKIYKLVLLMAKEEGGVDYSHAIRQDNSTMQQTHLALMNWKLLAKRFVRIEVNPIPYLKK